MKRRNSAKAETLTPPGIGLGLEAGKLFDDIIAEERLILALGDTVVFYTDGITEARNPRLEEFVEHRLLELIEQHGNGRARELRDKILGEVHSFCNGAEQHDDITMVIVKIV